MQIKLPQPGILSIKSLTLIISGGTFLGMSCYEIIKEYLLPDISKWQSHIITIVITGVLVAIISWISLQKQNEMVTRAAKATRQADITTKHLVSIVESSEDAIISINSDGNITSWNTGAEHIFGVSAKEVMNQSFNRFIPLEIKDRIPHLIQQTGIKKRVTHAEAVFQKKDGTRIHLSITASPIPLTSEHGGCISIIARDISTQIAREEMLKMLNLKQHLLSAISRHDVNNSLQVLMLCNTLLEEQITDPELQKIVQTIQKQSQIISSHIEFMKDYESLGIQAPSWQNAYDLFDKASAPFSSGSVKFENSLENLEIYADPLIEKVMYNLCDNAMKYGVNLTYIHAYYQPDGESCLIIVEDDGIGIQNELKERIFEKGFGKTSGLGLFFIKEILSITNIAIRETGIQDTGARFELIIPAGNWRVRFS